MARYRFELATPRDDAQLRSILAQTPMPGRISASFHCEPSFFTAAQVLGANYQVVACRKVESKQVVGFGCRSIQVRYVNGSPRPIGYLNTLRLLRQHRNRGLVARGYRFFADLHQQDRSTELYLTTIAEGNVTAAQILTSGRAGLPIYHPAGTYITLAIPVRGKATVTSSKSSPRNVDVRAATNRDLKSVLNFLAREGPKRQFFPKYTADSFFCENATFRDLKCDDLFLAYDGDRMVGTLASWNQSGFRQFVVNEYEAPLRWLRPAINFTFALRGLPKLPRQGEAFRYAMAAIPLVVDNNATVFKALLEANMRRLRETNVDYLLLGLHESDPLLPIAKPYKTAEYRTKLYVVSWPDEDQLRSQLDDRPAYLELGAL